MIVLALSAVIIAFSTMAAISLLLDLDVGRNKTAGPVF